VNILSFFITQSVTTIYETHVYTYRKSIQDAQLSQRDGAAGCVIVFAKRKRLEPRDNILRTL